MIELRDITVSLPAGRHDAVAILHNIDLSVAGGEWVVLIGPNGCGKTTLLMTIAGLVPATSGTRSIARKDRTPCTVALLFQEPDNQFIASSVRDELRLSLPPQVPRESEHAQIGVAAQKFTLAGLLDRNPHQLSGGEKQRLAFATVWLSAPDILLLDEPTSYLDHEQRRRCIEFVAAMRAGGSTIVWATPRHDEQALATRFVCMAGGTITDDRSVGSEAVKQLVDDRAASSEAVKQPVDDRAASGEALTRSNEDGDQRAAGHDAGAASASAPASRESIVELHSVTFGYDGTSVIKGLSARVEAGECVGIAGANGSGKSTLLGLLSGLVAPNSGRIECAYKKPVSGGQQNIFYLFQSPERLFFAETVREEMAFGLRSLGVPAPEIASRVAEALAEVELASFDQRLPFSLSLGEMRRLAFAIARVLEPKLLLLDEPTSCLDRGGEAIFDRLIASMREVGTTLIIASHDRSLLSRTTDRIIEL